MSSTRQLIQAATILLQQAGCDAARLDAELLLMSVWSIQRTDLIIRAHDQIPDDIEQRFNVLLKRRQQREPLAYILAEKEFWSRPFYVNPDVLIPRPETEHLIEAVLKYFPNQQGAYHFCDIGTGSGCIAITLACEYPNAHIIATDISKAAIDVAKNNAATHHVEHRITFRRGDMLLAMQATDKPCDAIVSNPPYVTTSEMDDLEQDLFHEPRHALTDEGNGLRFLNHILQTAAKHLCPDGFIILETGPCGLPPTPHDFHLEHHIHDLAGHRRGGIYRHHG